MLLEVERRSKPTPTPSSTFSGRPRSRSEIQSSSALSEAKLHGAPLLEATGARSGAPHTRCGCLVVFCVEPLWEGFVFVSLFKVEAIPRPPHIDSLILILSC